jgi:hypothetical protein
MKFATVKNIPVFHILGFHADAHLTHTAILNTKARDLGIMPYTHHAHSLTISNIRIKP